MSGATFKALSALLAYPSAELQMAGDELRQVIAAEAIVPPTVGLGALIDEIADSDLIDLEERYVELFDRTRMLSLHLFEHVHGESRDRGQAMIDLKNLYDGAGLAIAGSELPDYLPLFLEYLSTRPLQEARELLRQTAHILAGLGERLAKRSSRYGAILAALVEIAATDAAQVQSPAILSEAEIAADDFASLDAAWVDDPVSFSPPASDCRDDLVARIRAAKRRAAPRPQ